MNDSFVVTILNSRNICKKRRVLEMKPNQTVTILSKFRSSFIFFNASVEQQIIKDLLTARVLHNKVQSFLLFLSLGLISLYNKNGRNL